MVVCFLGGRVISLDGVSVRYRQGLAIDTITGTFGEGQSTAIVGENGAGKTTLLKAIAGLAPLCAGTIGACCTRAYLPQRAEFDPYFPITVAELVLSGTWKQYGAWRRINDGIYQQVEAALEHIGLAALANQSLSTLSGGQLQRARFARLIVQNAPTLLLDEPFNNLDPYSRDVLLQQLTRFKREGRTIIAAMHDLALVSTQFDNVLLLAKRVLAWGKTKAVLPQVLEHMAKHWCVHQNKHDG